MNKIFFINSFLGNNLPIERAADLPQSVGNYEGLLRCLLGLDKSNRLKLAGNFKKPINLTPLSQQTMFTAMLSFLVAQQASEGSISLSQTKLNERLGTYLAQCPWKAIFYPKEQGGAATKTKLKATTYDLHHYLRYARDWAKRQGPVIFNRFVDLIIETLSDIVDFNKRQYYLKKFGLHKMLCQEESVSSSSPQNVNRTNGPPAARPAPLHGATGMIELPYPEARRGRTASARETRGSPPCASATKLSLTDPVKPRSSKITRFLKSTLTRGSGMTRKARNWWLAITKADEIDARQGEPETKTICGTPSVSGT